MFCIVLRVVLLEGLLKPWDEHFLRLVRRKNTIQMADVYLSKFNGGTD